MNKQDLRVVKTRRNIENTFIDLLSRYPFANITIQILLDTALINRSTFYKHYQDKYDLTKQLINREFNDFSLLLNDRFSSSTLLEFSQSFSKIYQVLYKKREVILALWSIQTDDFNLYDRMSLELKTRFTSTYVNCFSNKEEQLDYLATLYASLTMSSIKWYLLHPTVSIQEISTPIAKELYQAIESLCSDPA